MFGTLGAIVGFAGDFAPRYWAYCDGTTVSSQDSPYYVQLVGSSFGGDGSTSAATPNLAPFTAQSGAEVKKIICLNGDYLSGQANTTAEAGQAVVVDRFLQKEYWLICDGSQREIEGDQALYSLIQNQFGGSLANRNFDIPQLSPEPAQGTDQTVPYILCRYGIYPSQGGGESGPGSNPNDYLGQVQLFAFNFQIVGWLPCDGRLLDIPPYVELFSLIGTIYGGDGVRKFALPNLQSVASEKGGVLTPMICVNGLYPSRP